MRLIDAYNLLVEDGIPDNCRYFSEIYKVYGFSDETPLREYLDFIVHEPVHWMRGFPSNLSIKIAFSKPKTALIKLLKKPAVSEALGAEYISHIHDTVWNTFKKEGDRLLKERDTVKNTISEPDNSEVDTMSLQSLHSPESKKSAHDRLSVGSVESFEIPPAPPLRSYKTMALPQMPQAPTLRVESLEPVSDVEERVAFLKSVLFAMADSIPQAGVADAFRQLVSRV
jgi:hypothetical protein